MRTIVLPLSSDYDRAIHSTLIQQVLCAVLSLLMLDLGQTARVCGITMVAYWSAAAIVMLRRPRTPTWTDRAFLRWGFVPLFAAALVLARSVGD